MTGSAPHPGVPRTGAWRIPLTILGTVLIVAAEFALLMAVYRSPNSVQHQQLLAQTLTGRAAATQPGPTAATLADELPAGLRALTRAGLSSGRARAVTDAAAQLADAPNDAARLTAIQTALASLNKHLVSARQWADRRAELIYAGLLVIVSIGWMVWFRRLVSRHRHLQSLATEQQAKAESEQRLASLVRNSADLIAVCDVDATVSFVTPAVKNVLGLGEEDVLGHTITKLVHPEDRGKFVQLMAGRHLDDEKIALRMRHADGRFLHMDGTMTNLVGETQVDGIVITVRDVTARHELEARLTHQAFHDSLTTLANRSLFIDRLDHSLRRRRHNQQPLVVLFCDLDDFKDVNDGLGHGAGDSMLIAIGERLESAARASDTVARLGGDEFAVLMEDTHSRERSRGRRDHARLAGPTGRRGRPFPDAVSQFRPGGGHQQWRHRPRPAAQRRRGHVHRQEPRQRRGRGLRRGRP